VIKIHTLTIEEFRGIRKLKLELAGRNFAIYGPNGTGKSGVVDAIEFAITGNVSRLTGQGTLELRLKAHAPHVDTRDRPDKSRVILDTYVPSLKKNLRIERRVSDPNKPIITPAGDPEVEAVVAELAMHPEFALTRREIIKYVLAAPGERSKEVQALLRLDEIEKVRQSLGKIHNSSKATSKQTELELIQARTQLMRGLGISSLRRDEVIREVNKRRLVLRMAELTDIGPSTSIKGDLAGSGQPLMRHRSKKQILTELESVQSRVNGAEPEPLTVARQLAAAKIQKLLQSPSLIRNLKKESFLRSGLDLIEEECCPFCEIEWDTAALRENIRKKLDEAKAATELRETLARDARPLSLELLDLETLGGSLCAEGKKLKEGLPMAQLATWVERLKRKREHLTSLRELDETSADLAESMYAVDPKASSELEELRNAVAALPDATQEEEAREFLTVGQERLEVFREAGRQHDRSSKQRDLAAKVLTAFNDTASNVLTLIYRSVEQDFSRFYQLLNAEDEPTFTGKLVPSLGKLGFDVDFYGRGLFPPGAYHSEGHQDSMGLCLYLALMRRTLGDKFAFAVLDDVLMSIDSAHRREVCALLKTQFPDTQFVITTHDEIWLYHMRTEQLVKSKASVQFRRWTVDDGPVVWEGGEAWDQINRELNDGNVAGAAGTLRRYLEYVSGQLSSKLRANVEYRGDAQYDLGELLPAVLGAYNRLLGKAQDAAQSWGNSTESVKLSQRQKEFSAKVTQSNVEQWSINKSIHYNEWVKLQKQDFIPVVEAFKQLLSAFQCPTCLTFLYVTPPRGQQEGVRCDCSAVNINLKKK
jgi:AAA domain